MTKRSKATSGATQGLGKGTSGIEDREGLLDILLELVPAMVAYIDSDGYYRLVNHGVAAFFGEDPETMVGRDAFIANDRGHRIARSAFDRALAGEKVTFQTEVTDVDGRALTLENNYYPQIINEIVVGVCIFSYDVSDRVRAARALRESRERFRRLVEIIPHGISRIDTNGQITMLNPAHAEMLGYSCEDLTGSLIWNLFAPEEREKQKEIFFKAINERPEPLPNIAQCVRYDGSLIDVMFNWTYEYDQDDNFQGFISVMTDVTEQLATRHTLVEAKEIAERANEEKSRFLAATSHDLQQPLHSLSIMLGLLHVQKDEARREEILGTMERAVEGAQGLLRAVLDLSKLEAGVVTPRLERVSVNDLFEQIGAELGPQTMATDVELRVAPSSRTIVSDRALLKSVLYNLVSNAIRYTPRGKVLMGARLQESGLALEVWDTGVGIPKSRQQDIFKEFTRLESRQPETGAVHSLGLGLSIVDRSCRLLGHRLTLDSEPGKGSVFRVLVPLAHTDLDEKDEGHVSDALSGGVRQGFVLIVEDDPVTADTMQGLLEEWGYECILAQDRSSALDRCAEAGAPALMLVDYNLGRPENGLDVVETIRRSFGRKIPATLITGSQERGTFDEAHKNGIPIQIKPVNPARLRALVSFHISRNPDGVGTP